MIKRIFSMFLVLAMVVGMLPTAAFAADADNLCAHHSEHTAECGYAAAVAGADCTHAHDELCGYAEAVEEVLCACEAAEDGTLTHAEGCGYVAPVAGTDCTHAHDELCGYVAALEEQPCTYECAECAAAGENPSDTTEPEGGTGNPEVTITGITYSGETVYGSP